MIPRCNSPYVCFPWLCVWDCLWGPFQCAVELIDLIPIYSGMIAGVRNYCVQWDMLQFVDAISGKYKGR